MNTTARTLTHVGRILGALTFVAVLGFGFSVLAGNDQASAENSLVPGKSEEAAIFLTEVPSDYRNWQLVGVSRLTAPQGAQLRATLGNNVAIKAYREGTLPFPDGAIIAALHWKEVSSEDNDRVLAQGFPGADRKSFVPGSPVNVQFMVKDSRKYAATGGWGFGDFTNGQPGNAALMKTCFACHTPARDHDFVFTRYVP